MGGTDVSVGYKHTYTSLPGSKILAAIQMGSDKGSMGEAREEEGREGKGRQCVDINELTLPTVYVPTSYFQLAL